MSETDTKKAIEDLQRRITILERDLAAIKDSSANRAFYNINGGRGVPEMPTQKKMRIHPEVYFALGDSPDIYKCKNLQEFAAIQQLEYQHGVFGGMFAEAKQKSRAEVLHLEALFVSSQLKKRGIRLAMFAHYLTADYKRVPYVELFTPHDPAIDEWIAENDCIITNINTPIEPPERDERDPKMRLEKCKNCIFRRESPNRAITCTKHRAILPRYYTKLDVRNYLESARKNCDYPKCYKPQKI